MIDLESMIKSLRLAWLKRIFGENDGAWKSYLRVSPKRHTEVSFYSIATAILKITMFPLFFILSYFSGGQNFEMAMVQRMATYSVEQQRDTNKQ